MKYLILIAIATVAFAFRAVAQPAEPARSWTLEECMLYAIENSSETNIQAERNNIAKQDYREAIGSLLPTLNAGTSATFNFGRGLGDDNVYVDAKSFSNSYSASSSLTIFGGLRNINNIRLQKVNRIIGRHQLDQRRDEVALSTMEAFFNVLYYTKMVVLAESQLEESRLNLRQTERMEELGVKGFPHVAEMRAQEAANSYSLTDWQNRLAIGIILLKEQMNFPIERTLVISPYDLDVEVAKTLETAGQLYERALSHLPKALGVASEAQASKVALQIARGARFPTISLGAGYSTGFFRNLDGSEYDSFSNQFANKRGYYVGVSLNIPIFNRFSISANIRRSKYNYLIAQIERDYALRALYTEIEQAVADVNGTADQYAQSVRQREFAAVAYEVNQRKYDEGLVSAIELHTSSNRLVQARATELQSRLTWILKKRWIDYYSGLPLVKSQSEN